MRILKSIGFIGLALNFAACSSVQKSGVENVGEERILSRIDGLSSRPSWLKESEPFRIENGKVLSIGSATIPGDHRTEAGFRISDNNSKASIASAIEQRLEFVFQNAEEGTAIESTQARFIGAEASKLTANSIRPGHHYWEKVSIVGENGQFQVRYRLFSEMVMPENDFKAAVIDAVRKAQGKGGLSADFAKKVEQHWDQFTREPASSTPVAEKN